MERDGERGWLLVQGRAERQGRDAQLQREEGLGFVEQHEVQALEQGDEQGLRHVEWEVSPGVPL